METPRTRYAEDDLSGLRFRDRSLVKYLFFKSFPRVNIAVSQFFFFIYFTSVPPVPFDLRRIL